MWPVTEVNSFSQSDSVGFLVSFVDVAAFPDAFIGTRLNTSRFLCCFKLTSYTEEIWELSCLKKKDIQWLNAFRNICWDALTMEGRRRVWCPKTQCCPYWWELRRGFAGHWFQWSPNGLHVRRSSRCMVRVHWLLAWSNIPFWYCLFADAKQRNSLLSSLLLPVSH